MLRMLHKTQQFPTTTRPTPKTTSLFCNNFLVAEFFTQLKQTLKSEDWALFALVGILSCDIAIVLTMLAYKKVFNEAISKPLTIACPFLTVFGIVHIFISWYIYIKKKRRLYRSRRENSREYIQALIYAEDEMKLRSSNRNVPEGNDYHVVIQEIKPGMIFGKVIHEKESTCQDHSGAYR